MLSQSDPVEQCSCHVTVGMHGGVEERSWALELLDGLGFESATFEMGDPGEIS